MIRQYLQHFEYFLEIGNEDFLPGFELSNDVTDFYKKFPSNSSHECQAECKNRFFCRAWSVLVYSCSCNVMLFMFLLSLLLLFKLIMLMLLLFKMLLLLSMLLLLLFKIVRLKIMLLLFKLFLLLKMLMLLSLLLKVLLLLLYIRLGNSHKKIFRLIKH